jgi:SprT protein
VAECFAIASERFNRPFETPTIRFAKRGTTAGTASSKKWELNFNEILLNENVEHFVKQTVAHEVAHLIDHAVFDSHAVKFCSFTGKRKKRQSHGANWKRVMYVLGVPADRCHTYDVANSKIKRRPSATFDYKCTGCGKVVSMGKIRHGKMQSGTASYSHNGCRGAKLVYTKQG